MKDTREYQRLLEHRRREANWRNWGPYLAERAWGTVREDYSADGAAWEYFPHDHARSRAYRWNEDGLMGISDRTQHLCFAWALWNGRDPILKERLFGLTGHEGNHGEDVKEAYFYLDNTPTHSYLKMLYRYPQAAYPYAELVAENARRGRRQPEYELIDTGVFDENRFFDAVAEYAKAGPDDILIRLTVHNRGPQAADLRLLATLWLRNTWSWGYTDGPLGESPERAGLRALDVGTVETEHASYGNYRLHAEKPDGWLFTENETNFERLYGSANPSPYVKDAFHRYVIAGEAGAINPAGVGTKAAADYDLRIGAGEAIALRLRLVRDADDDGDPFGDFDALFEARLAEADAFYAAIQRADLSAEERSIQRQALAGMLWNKQLYYFDVEQWLRGDPAQPDPPPGHKTVRDSGWEHLHSFDVLSMPDKWEYPWFATWDTAFHSLPLVLVDPDYAKRQLELFTREWYMHPNGALPAYEWAFDDVNPPVHAWATWRVYQIDRKQAGEADRPFLEEIFHKLLLNFTWWVNRKDADGHNVFQGGFLGLDNISVFDRSRALPTGGHIDQADGTAWMGFYCLVMMKIALELAKENPVYQDSATKFFEHFLRIATAMTDIGPEHHALWDEDDGFFYDVLHLEDGRVAPLKVRSLVGLMPLLAVETIEPDLLAQMPVFERRMDWFVSNRPHLSGNMAELYEPGVGERRLLAILTPDRLRSVLRYMLDEDEFLSPYGIRSVSKVHQDHPYTFQADGQAFTLRYEPAESETGVFGGNSNWRGPVWFPINYLIIESLQKFAYYYGDDFRVECPTGSGHLVTLNEVARDLSRRLIRLFVAEAGQRPIYGGSALRQSDPLWRDTVLFYEYFHGDTGAGLGATHQTGWTGLVAKLIQQSGGGMGQ